MMNDGPKQREKGKILMREGCKEKKKLKIMKTPVSKTFYFIQVPTYSATSLVRPKLEELIPEKNSLEKISKNYDLDFYHHWRPLRPFILLLVHLPHLLGDLVGPQVHHQVGLHTHTHAHTQTRTHTQSSLVPLKNVH